MAEKVWLGGIYLKDEGGYEIILKSLKHYKNRLKTLSASPEIKDAGGTFGLILNQQAIKTVPKINKVIEKIQTSLYDVEILKELEKERQFLDKALSCYKSDIHKAEDTGNQYHVKLVGDMIQGRLDLNTIKTALEKINNFSD